MTDIAPPRPGSTRHLVWLYHDASRRDGIAALFALEREIAASARSDLDHAVTHTRLDWWQSEAQQLAARQPAHPFGHRLLAALRESGAAPPNLVPLVEATRWAAAATAFQDRAELNLCFEAWSAAVFVNATALASPPVRPASIDIMRESGRALREIEALGRLRAYAMLGRVYLPIDELEALGLDHRAVTCSPWQQTLATHIATRLRICREILHTASTRLPRDERAALRGLMVWMALGMRRAERAAADLPFQYAARRGDGIAAAWRAWRAARSHL